MASLGTLAAKITADNSEFVKSMRGIETAAKRTAVASAAAFAGLTAIIGKSVKAFDGIELATNRAVIAGRKLGPAFDPKRLTDFAEAMQQLTRFTDDQVLASQAMAFQAGLNQTQAEHLTRSVANLAQATGMDLERATGLATRAIHGSATTLERYGVFLDDATKAAWDTLEPHERLAKITEALDSNFDGMAKAGSQAARQWAVLQNNVSNVWEEFGKVADSPVTAVLQRLTGIVRGLTKWIQGMDDATKAAAGRWVVFSAVAAGGLVVISGIALALPSIVAGFKLMAGAVMLAALPLMKIAVLVAAAIGAVALLRKAWIEDWGGIATAIRRDLEMIGDDIKKFAGFVDKVFTWVRDQVIDAFVGILETIPGLMQRLFGIVADMMDRIPRRLMTSAMRETQAAMRAASRVDLTPAIEATIGFARKTQEQSVGEQLLSGIELTFADMRRVISEGSEGAMGALRGVMNDAKDWLLDLLPDELKAGFLGLLDQMEELELSTKGLNQKIHGAKGANGAATEATEELTDALDEAVVAIRDRFTDTINALAGQAIAGSGSMGRLVQTGASAGEMGGPLAAAAAIALEVLMMSEQFGTLVGAANDAIQMVADGLGTVLTPLLTHLGGVILVLNSVMDIITPILASLGEAFTVVAPFLVVLATVLAGMVPIFDAVGRTFGMLMPLLEGVFAVVFTVFRGAALIVLAVVWAIQKAWNFVLDTIAGVLETLRLDSAAGKLRDMMADVTATEDAMGALVDMTWESAKAQAEAAGAIDDLGDAANAAAGALLNVPRGFRVARARWEAQDPVAQGLGGGLLASILGGIPQFGSGGIVTSPTLAIVGESGPEAIVPLTGAASRQSGDTFNLHFHGRRGENDEAFARRVARTIEQQQSRRAVTRTGSRIAVSTSFSGDQR